MVAVSSTTDSVQIQLDDVSLLRKLALVDANLDILAETRGTTFRTKFVELDSGTVRRLQNAGIVEDKSSVQLSDWGLTKRGRQLVEIALEYDVPELTEYQVEAIFKHHELVLSELPDEETFEASDYELCPREVAHLRRAGLLNVASSSPGVANQWEVSSTTEELRATFELVEREIDCEAIAVAEVAE